MDGNSTSRPAASLVETSISTRSRSTARSCAISAARSVSGAHERGDSRLAGLFLAACRENGLGIAVRLLAALEDQVASGLECNAVLQAAAHRLISRVAGILFIHHLRHAAQGRHHVGWRADP